MSHNVKIKKMIGNALLDIAEGLQTGNLTKKVKIGLTLDGSEHGNENLIQGAVRAMERYVDIEVVLIGDVDSDECKVVKPDDNSDIHKIMERLLDEGEIDACVTMHYNFPVGVSTVGRVITPGRGKEMILATTTGTSDTGRRKAMIKNAINGIIVAKSIGIKKPTVGVLNLDNARNVEKSLKALKDNGYDIEFGESGRSDGGNIMRGNDLLTGSVDVMVTDTLTGNILMKMFSSFTTGGSYEAIGYGYGPGIGKDYNRLILIISRASGVPVVENAIKYAADLYKNNVFKIQKNEYLNAENCGLNKILSSFNKRNQEEEIDIPMPEKEVVTGTITGIDIMELEMASKVLWKNGIYAESGMGCTGPIILVSEEKITKALEILAVEGYPVKDGSPC